MHVSNVSVNQPANQYLRAIAHCAGQGEDLSTLRVRPPASVNRFASNRAGEGRRAARARLKHQPVLTYESERFSGCGDYSVIGIEGGHGMSASAGSCTGVTGLFKRGGAPTAAHSPAAEKERRRGNTKLIPAIGDKALAAKIPASCPRQ